MCPSSRHKAVFTVPEQGTAALQPRIQGRDERQQTDKGKQRRQENGKKILSLI